VLPLAPVIRCADCHQQHKPRRTGRRWLGESKGFCNSTSSACSESGTNSQFIQSSFCLCYSPCTSCGVKENWTSAVCFLLVFRLSLRAHHSHRPTAHGVRSTKAIPQEAYAGYWTDEPGWHTELEIRNNLRAAPIEVTPVLRLSDGTEISLSPQNIEANSAVMVDVSAELEARSPASAGRSGTFGSVVFRYTASNSTSVFAAAMVERTGAPIKYHFDAFPYTSEFTSTSVESIWWLPKPSSTNVLVVANMTDKPIAAKVSITNSKGKPVALSDGLAPRQTKRFIVRELVQSGKLDGTEGGVSVTFDKPVGINDVQVSHFVYDETNGSTTALTNPTNCARNSLPTNKCGSTYPLPDTGHQRQDHPS